MTDRIIVRTLAGDVFRLNLDNLNIVYTQESPRHIDHFSTEFSFPFEFHVDRDLMVILGSLTHIPLAPQTVFDNCLHVVDGRIRPAKLTILKSVGRVVHAQVDAGFAQLSTWDIKLQDLALDVVQNPLQDAPSKINLAWPAVNYNYPALHTDIYNDEPMMSEFRGTYNLRQGSEFVQNTQVVNSN
ncbi:MAG: hypothetical protein Q4F57_02385, partial [Weeksellaceae bacterium]|nr:hypothetical protein [Weeksellaceae bacterium]